MPRANRCQEIHFAWQAQYLVKLECDFSWQAQHLVTFWEIAGARNVGCEMTILSSDYPRNVVESSFYIGGSNSESVQCNLELKDFVAGAVFGEVRG